MRRSNPDGKGDVSCFQSACDAMLCMGPEQIACKHSITSF